MSAPPAQRRNPTIAGFFPDPSVCRVGEDYYCASSSFEYFPGVPIHHSRDLLHWRLVGNALDRPEQLPLDGAGASGGVFAPTLRHHDGRFWLITTNVSAGGHLIVTADDPAGPWSDSVVVEGIPGIDPDLAWDADGTCWLTYSDHVVGTPTSDIKQVALDPLAGRALTEPKRLWSGTGLQFPEAPHLYEVDGTWYLLIAEGGTGPGHAVSIARGPAPSGPFEGCPANPILSHRSTDHPVQSTGHADLVARADGSWAIVFLGVRPGGTFPPVHVLGRETFTAQVEWFDGWPAVGPVALGAPARATHARDDFEDAALAPQWISVRARPAAMWSLTARPGWLVLHGVGASMDDAQPAFVGRRQQHLRCRARALVDATGGRGGLAVRIDEAHHYGVELEDGWVRCHARIGPLRACVGAERIEESTAVLRIETLPDGDVRGPDAVALGVERDGAFSALATLDGRYLSTEVAGGFTGRVIGMYAVDGAVAFDWFDYEAVTV
jgi:xylan 1,4-beta-xylosidase